LPNCVDREKSVDKKCTQGKALDVKKTRKKKKQRRAKGWGKIDRTGLQYENLNVPNDSGQEEEPEREK